MDLDSLVRSKRAGVDSNEVTPGKKSEEEDDVLGQSDMTPLTEGSTSYHEDGGWLGGIGADFLNIANSIKDAVPPAIGAIGDIASFVQRSAMLVAAEIAQMERDSSSDDEAGPLENSIPLPWEILSETNSGRSEYREDPELKASILALSTDRTTFLKPFSSMGSSNCLPEDESKLIVLNEPRIQQIRRLLSLDENLAATHSSLSGRKDVKETLFWTNYFLHCEEVRRKHLERLHSSSIDSTFSNPPGDPQSAVLESSAEACKSEALIAVDGSSVSRASSQNSLVPADDTPSQAAERTIEDVASSYVRVNMSSGIASPPCSLLSVEDLVLVNMSLSGEK